MGFLGNLIEKMIGMGSKLAKDGWEWIFILKDDDGVLVVSVRVSVSERLFAISPLFFPNVSVLYFLVIWK